MIFNAKCCLKALALNFLIFSVSSVLADEESVVPIIRSVQLSVSQKRFLFEEQKNIFFLTEEGFQNFWKENSRIENDEAPKMPVHWGREILIGIFWKSQDRVIRYPALWYSERKTETVTDKKTGKEREKKVLILHYSLITPCFGIITDDSPASFLVFKSREMDFEELRVDTSPAQMRDCMSR